VNTTDPNRANGIRIFLWTLVGAACGIVAFDLLQGAKLQTMPEAANPSLWIGLVAFLVMVAGLSWEAARDTRLPALRWIGLLLLVVAVVASNAPLLATLGQLAMTLGLVAAFALVVYLLIGVFGPKGQPSKPAVPRRNRSFGLYVGGAWLSPGHVAAMSLIVGVVTGVAITELAALEARALGIGTSRTPRTVEVLRNETLKPVERLVLAGATHAEATSDRTAVPALLIDANWSGKVVLFDHDAHQSRQGGAASCGRCHHYNMRLAKGTSCAVCHRGVGEASRAFDHGRHVGGLGGNSSCVRCHPDNGDVQSVASASCGQADCHPAPSDVEGVVKVAGRADGTAPSYVDAMHGLCVRCHKMEEANRAATTQYLSNCTVCHQLERSGTGELQPDQLLQPGASQQLLASHQVGGPKGAA